MKFLSFPLMLVAIGMTISCSKPTKKSSEMVVSLKNNSLAIEWQGKDRLIGGLPKFENAPSNFSSFSTSGIDNKLEFLFQLTNAANKVTVGAEVFTNSNTVILSVSPNGNHSKKGSDYVGLFFNQIPNYKIGTALFKYAPVKAWTHPVQVKTMKDLNEEDNQFYLWQYNDSTYAAAAPLAGQGYVACIGKDSNNFGAKARSYFDNMSTNKVPVLAIAFGSDPYSTINNLYETSLTYMGKSENLRKNKTYPILFESLGWCTWNAFQHSVNEEKIISGLKSFQENNIAIPTLIIDDGWMQITGDWGKGSLAALEVSREKFPNGFKKFVQHVKQQYHVQDVGVWHAFNGYWSGIDTNSSLGKKYKNSLMPYQDRVTWGDKPVSTFYMPTPKSAEGEKFYSDWYAYLKGEGMSFVKVDNQLISDRISKNNLPFWNAATQAEANVQNAVKKYFQGNLINCMDMTVDAVYNFGSSPIARSEEDYLPEVKEYKLTGGNAASHVLCAGYNSLWFSPMVWCDYDMFQTHHDNAIFHAVARAISGGPIYITDIPGKQNFDIIRALTTSDGRILRTDVPALPTEDCLFNVTDSLPLKLFSKVGSTGIVASFNAADANAVNGTLKPSDVVGIDGDLFLVYEHFTKRHLLLKKNESMPFSLNRMQVALYYIVPIQHNAAMIGLAGKYNAPKTIINTDYSEGKVQTLCREEGVFVCYLKTKPKSITVNGKVITTAAYTFQQNLLTVDLKGLDKDTEKLIDIAF